MTDTPMSATTSGRMTPRSVGVPGAVVQAHSYTGTRAAQVIADAWDAGCAAGRAYARPAPQPPPRRRRGLLMTVTVGQWRHPTRTGTDVAAHRVAAVIPDVTRYANPDPADRAVLVHAADCDRWIALCEAAISDRSARTEYVAMFTRPAPWPDTDRCSTCEVLSGPFERWLTEHPVEQAVT